MSTSSEHPRALDETDVAVIGAAVRLPGANHPSELERMLERGGDPRLELDEALLRAAGVDATTRADPAYVRVWCGPTEASGFDAALFGLSPHDAALLDPQHRVWLECAWAALEDAGHDPSQSTLEIGVYAACGISSYLHEQLLPDAGLVRDVGLLALVAANDKDTLAARVSYHLDLTGPSVAVQSNCSSSLVAVHVAINDLLGYHCDVAVVGGVSLKNPLPRGYRLDPAGSRSPTGYSRSFDASADGMLLSDGAAAVVLRRASEAHADGDFLYGLIKGSAVNNDGGHKVGFTGPGHRGQARVVTKALRAAGVDPQTIGYVEASASGSPVGDGLELRALAEALGPSPRATRVGALKSFIGNTDGAAGVASLLSGLLAVRRGRRWGVSHFRTPLPEIEPVLGRLAIDAAPEDWPAQPGPRRAGISAFGVGGTNAHVIVEQAPPRPPRPSSRRWQPLLVSARSAPALVRAVRALAAHLERGEVEGSLADVAWTTAVGRRAFAHRACVVAHDLADAVAKLGALAARLEAHPSEPAGTDPEVGLWCGPMAHEAVASRLQAWRAEPGYARAWSACEALGRSHDGPHHGPHDWPRAQVALVRWLEEIGVGFEVVRGSPDAQAVVDVLAPNRPPVAAWSLGITLVAELDDAAPPPARPGDPERIRLLGGPGEDASLALLTGLGRLWTRGVGVRWERLQRGEPRHRVPLPPYPFERRSWWRTPPPPEPSVGAQPHATAPDRTPRPALEVPYAAPRGPTEALLAEIWAQRLGFDRVGRDDVFLELGGDSLTAAQVLGAVAERTGVRLRIQVFFEAPTIAGQARLIDAERERSKGGTE